MLLKDKQTGDLVKVLDTDTLIDPSKTTVSARFQAGQEEQDPEEFSKDALVFPSDEALPQCWKDPDYQLHH
ncbi:MAG: acetyltransferase [Leptolyngbyaceae cyanobacterium bins.302]|nr:acetyltransferase [Leptolyngbyaceae cyanobacterium bins.302]